MQMIRCEIIYSFCSRLRAQHEYIKLSTVCLTKQNYDVGFVLFIQVCCCKVRTTTVIPTGTIGLPKRQTTLIKW